MYCRVMRTTIIISRCFLQGRNTTVGEVSIQTRVLRCGYLSVMSVSIYWNDSVLNRTAGVSRCGADSDSGPPCNSPHSVSQLVNMRTTTPVDGFSTTLVVLMAEKKSHFSLRKHKILINIRVPSLRKAVKKKSQQESVWPQFTVEKDIKLRTERK